MERDNEWLTKEAVEKIFSYKKKITKMIFYASRAWNMKRADSYVWDMSLSRNENLDENRKGPSIKAERGFFPRTEENKIR